MMKRSLRINLAADFFLFAVSLYLALWLRFNGQIPPNYLSLFLRTALFVACGKCLVFFLAGIYRMIVKYIQTYDVINLLKSNLLSSAAFAVAVFFFRNKGMLYPRSTIIIDFLLSFFLTACLRYAEKYFLQNSARPSGEETPRSRCLIIGAGDAGSMVLREIRLHPEARIRVIGFIDDNAGKQGRSVGGKKVLGGREDILRLTHKKKIGLIIIAVPSAKRKDLNDIISICERADVQLKIVPSTYEIIAGNVRFEQIRDIKIEELLSRDEIRLGTKSVECYLKNRVILITGAGGSIGSEIARQVSSVRARKVLLLGKGENSIFSINAELAKRFPGLKVIPVIADVQDRDKMSVIFKEYRPDTVFHAAAHKHVHLMELHPDEAFRNNILGTLTLVRLCMEHRTGRFVLISTDKAVNPESIMGMTKRVAEKLLIGYASRAKSRGCRLMAVRFGNVLGSRGSVVPIFKEQIEAGGPVTVTHPDVTRYFMTIPEAVQLVLQAGGLGRGGEIFILQMGKPVRIVDLARKMISLSGYVPDRDIRIEFTGLKKGEKLAEELVNSSETLDETRYEKILVTRSRPVDLKRVLSGVEAMNGKIHSLSPRLIGAGLKRMI